MDLDALRASLLSPATAGDPWAAIAVVVAENGGTPSVLLIRRAEREGDPWSGQIACPGGRVETDDPTPLDACIREAREEVGLDLRGSANLLGLLPPRPPANRPYRRVAPFVWTIPSEVPPKPSDEVVNAWYLPLRGLRALDREVTVQTSRGPFRTHAFVTDDAVIWGFTYRVLVDLLDRSGG